MYHKPVNGYSSLYVRLIVSCFPLFSFVTYPDSSLDSSCYYHFMNIKQIKLSADAIKEGRSIQYVYLLLTSGLTTLYSLFFPRKQNIFMKSCTFIGIHPTHLHFCS
jgi:hypothetical protein